MKGPRYESRRYESRSLADEVVDCLLDVFDRLGIRIHEDLTPKYSYYFIVVNDVLSEREVRIILEQIALRLGLRLRFFGKCCWNWLYRENEASTDRWHETVSIACCDWLCRDDRWRTGFEITDGRL